MYFRLSNQQFERLAVRLPYGRLMLKSSKFSSETMQSKADVNSSSKFGLNRISDRCHFVQAPKLKSTPLTVDRAKVLVMMITWLGAKDSHILRYSRLYTKQGLDVLVVKSEAKDFTWPKNSLLLAEQVYKVLDNQMLEYKHIICHTMSAGSFNWTVLRMYLQQKENTEHICSKFRGLIFDSVVAGSGRGGILNQSLEDKKSQVHALERMVHGIVVAKQFSPIMQYMVKALSKVYFSVTKKDTVKFYEKTLTFFREEPLQVPTLFFTSKDDPMCDAPVLEKLVDIWREKQNVHVSIKVWESSPHAQHYIYHKETYERLHEELMKKIFMSIHSPSPVTENVKSKL